MYAIRSYYGADRVMVDHLEQALEEEGEWILAREEGFLPASARPTALGEVVPPVSVTRASAPSALSSTMRDVITSYSIHYTKLYERAHRGRIRQQVQRRARRGRGRHDHLGRSRRRRCAARERRSLFFV